MAAAPETRALGKFFYYLSATLESGLGLFGIRSPYEQPKYEIVQRLPEHVEIRQYAARVAAETPVEQGNEGAAFGRLFRYISGANHAGATLAMTVPVERKQLIAMTIPVETGTEMRFFLPRKVAEEGAPVPNDPQVHIVKIPPERIAALRFSGSTDDSVRDAKEAKLRAVLAEAHLKPEGAASLLTYDPPWTPPFLRRNEVVLKLAP